MVEGRVYVTKTYQTPNTKKNKPKESDMEG